MSIPAADRLRAHTAGNPLHVRALLRELPPGALAGGGPLPAPRSYATLVLARLAACHQPTRELVSALAVVGLAGAAGHGGRHRRARRPAARARRGGRPAAGRAGPVAGGAVGALRPPAGARRGPRRPPPSKQAALHQAAAAVIPGAGGLRHRLAGCAGYDAELAADALATAEAEADRGAYASAARLSMEAARVAPDPADRDDAMLDALDQLLLAGNVAEVRERRSLIDTAVPSARRSFMQGRLAYVLGPRPEAVGFLEDAWDQVTDEKGVPIDETLAGRVAALLATSAVDRADGDAGLYWAREALALARVAAADCNHGHMLAMASALKGRIPEGIAELTEALDDPPDHPAAVADLRMGRGVLRLWAHDLRRGSDDLQACLAAWGAGGGTFVSRETARFFLADLQYRAGRWDDALVTAEVAAGIVDETEQVVDRGVLPRGGGHPAGGARRVRPGRGPPAAARAAADAVNGGAASLWTTVAQMHLDEARGDLDALVRVGDLLSAPGVPTVDEGIAPWRASYVEALVESGRAEDARAVADRAVAAAAVSPSPLVKVEAARAAVAVAGARERRRRRQRRGGRGPGRARGGRGAVRPGPPGAGRRRRLAQGRRPPPQCGAGRGRPQPVHDPAGHALGRAGRPRADRHRPALGGPGHLRRHGAHGPGRGRVPPGGQGSHQPRDGGRAVPQREDGGAPPEPGLRQARRAVADRARPRARRPGEGATAGMSDPAGR